MSPTSKPLIKYTKKDFAAIPSLPWNSQPIGNSFVIIPTRRKHDSGYLIIDFAIFDGDTPIGAFRGGTDAVHLGGFSGGHNSWELTKSFAKFVKTHSWNFDLLPCGYFRFWPSTEGKIQFGCSLSNQEIKILMAPDDFLY